MRILIEADENGKVKVDTQGVPHPLELVDVMTQVTAQLTKTALQMVANEEEGPEILLPMPGNGGGLRSV